ncbi:cytochrome P450 [Kitasatospora viridis]|uniref:Cytochrome P450 n=1 Tax=Kitasatospora viridis TaxID=281105 RepID=A0A561T6D0_9ACTN|nr:cytochrome P450 [Kitasatospora viridis]TWF82667.1 cytochrome P450 [Kitasatospora viridis]
MTGDPLFDYPLRRGERLDPPPVLGELRADRPVCPVRLWDGSEAWLVTRHADVRAVLADPRVSADPRSPGYPFLSAGRAAAPDGHGSFNHLDPPEHGRFRRMLSGEFTVERIARLRPVVQRTVDRAIDAMVSAGNRAELVRALALPVPSFVICELLGVPYADHEFFETRTAARMDLTRAPELVRAANAEIMGYLEQLVAEKRRRPGDDLISRLITQHGDSGEASPGEIVDMVRLLLVNGYETTANMIALGVLVLLRNPDEAAVLRDDPDPEAVERLVEELLRHQTIVHIAPTRAVLAELTVGGTVLRPGDGVITSLSSANRDATVFDRPDALDCGRDARRHLSFGHGVHHCLGHTLARLELHAVFGTLFRRLPALRLAVPYEEVRFKEDAGLYGVHRLDVTW